VTIPLPLQHPTDRGGRRRSCPRWSASKADLVWSQCWCLELLAELRVRALAAMVIAALLAGCGGANEERPEHAAPFGYSGDAGPSRWGSIDPAYKECSEGERQSPIDLKDGMRSALPRIDFTYKPAELEVENNGHSLEAAYPPGSSVEIGGTHYELQQFHYHAPSEHEVSGRSLPMELHFVNIADDGRAAVLGVLVEEGQGNPSFSELVRALPTEQGATRRVEGKVSALDLLPPGPGSAPRWSYDGSLTTPPCTEGVHWHVFKEPIELSAKQLARYTAVYEDNNRPLQPLNGREPLSSR
jgi:carbonic anhydrase